MRNSICKTLIASLLAASLMLLAACGSGGGPIVRDDNEKPASQVEGYYSSAQMYHGGTDTLETNLRTLTVDEANGETVITLGFVLGSNASGEEETPAPGVPAHILRCLPQPHRLVLHLEGISYYDYFLESGIGQGHLVQSLFRQTLVSSQQTSLYFNLNSDVVYKVEERKDSLKITLKTVQTADAAAYYVVSNAYPEYLEGTVPVDAGLSPTICSDGFNKLLISQPFETQQLAQAFLDDSLKTVRDAVKSREFSVIQLAAGALPEYDKGYDVGQVSNKLIIKRKDAGEKLPLLLLGGRFLALAPNGDELFARTQMEAGQNDYYERLTLRKSNGEFVSLSDVDFYVIFKAVFSPDGKRLAFIDLGTSYRVLYILNLQTGELINASEEGLGLNTSSLAWADNNRLYAMSGLDDQKQLMMFDVSKAQGSRAAAVDEKPGAEGDLAVLNGKVYFSDIEQGKIFAVDLETLSRNEVCRGDWFVPAPDGKSLLVQQFGNDENQADLSRLVLWNLETKSEKVLLDQVMLGSFEFSPDGGTVYATYEISGEETFPWQLVVQPIAGEASKPLALCTPLIKPVAGGKLYVADAYDQQGLDVAATFTLQLP